MYILTRTMYVLDPHVLSEIREMIRAHFGDSSLDLRVEWVKDCCSKRDLLSVFELDSKNSAKDVDLAVLKALLKGIWYSAFLCGLLLYLLVQI